MEDDENLRTALGPSAGCLSVENLGRYADRALAADDHAAAERHIRNCLSCQAELALLVEVTSRDLRPEEAAIVRDGAARFEERAAQIDATHAGLGARLRSLAVAAALLLATAAGVSYLFLTRSAPELSGGETTGSEATRSLSIRLRGPTGEQIEVPRQFEWFAVDRAVRYRVRLMAVDRQELWSISTSELAVELPSSVRESITPGRTLLWDVAAYDGAGSAVAESGLQSFKVVAK